MSQTAVIPQSTPWVLPSRGIVGMACLIVAESAIFTIFVVAYLYYLGKDLTGPTPRQVFDLPIFTSICLLSAVSLSTSPSPRCIMPSAAYALSGLPSPYCLAASSSAAPRTSGTS